MSGEIHLDCHDIPEDGKGQQLQPSSCGHTARPQDQKPYLGTHSCGNKPCFHENCINSFKGQYPPWLNHFPSYRWHHLEAPPLINITMLGSRPPAQQPWRLILSHSVRVQGCLLLRKLNITLSVCIPVGLYKCGIFGLYLGHLQPHFAYYMISPHSYNIVWDKEGFILACVLFL